MSDDFDLRTLGTNQLILLLIPNICPYPGVRVSVVTILFNRAMDRADKNDIDGAKLILAGIGHVRIHDPNPLVRAWAEHCRKMLYSNSQAERGALRQAEPRTPNHDENTKTDAEIAKMVKPA